jgi:hypothetical protein
VKGQQKISRGTGFRGALNYDFDHDGGRIVGGNMGGTDPRSLAAEFAITRKLRPDIERPVWRNSLSLPNGEKLPQEKWAEIASAYIEAMGFNSENNQFCVVLHDKRGQQHIHVTASRIGLDGSVFLGRNENLISTKVISKLEKRFGLVETKTAQINPATGLPSTKSDKKKMRKGELEKAINTGFKPARLIIQEALDDVLSNATTETELSERLQEMGITMSVKTDQGEKVVGITFETDGVKFGGSKLGDSYRYQALAKKLKENRDERSTSDEDGPGRQTPQRPRPAGPRFGTGIKVGPSDNRDQKKQRTPVFTGISATEENRLLLLKTRNRIFSYSKAPLRISRLNYRLWKGRDGRIWLYDPATGQPAGLAFRDEGQGGKALEVHRPTLTDNDAEAVVRLAVESGIAGPLRIEGDKIFVQKITEAAHRLGVRVSGDPDPTTPEPASDEISFPDFPDLDHPPQPRQRI